MCDPYDEAEGAGFFAVSSCSAARPGPEWGPAPEAGSGGPDWLPSPTCLGELSPGFFSGAPGVSTWLSFPRAPPENKTSVRVEPWIGASRASIASVSRRAFGDLLAADLFNVEASTYREQSDAVLGVTLNGAKALRAHQVSKEVV